MKLEKKKWEKKWVIVFFDIPEEGRNKREYLRRFLKEIGFYPYQKSVYVFPYECKKEIDLIKKIIAGGKYLKYVIATQIEDEKKIKKYFNYKWLHLYSDLYKDVSNQRLTSLKI